MSVLSSLQEIAGISTKGVLMISKVNIEFPEPGADTTVKKTASNALASLAANNIKAVSAVASGLSKLKGALDAVRSGSLLSGEDWSDYAKIQVQYNPASINISTQNGDIVNPSTSDSNIGMIEQLNISRRTTFSVDLWFDHTNLSDAFRTTETMLTFGNAVDVAGRVGTAIIGGEYSIKKYAEMLLGAMCDSTMRNVAFVWGKQIFKGVLTNVDPTYTMFNKQGDPIRGKIAITILQSVNNDSQSYWEKSYDNLKLTYK